MPDLVRETAIYGWTMSVVMGMKVPLRFVSIWDGGTTTVAIVKTHL